MPAFTLKRGSCRLLLLDSECGGNTSVYIAEGNERYMGLKGKKNFLKGENI